MLILSIDQSMSCSGYAWLDSEGNVATGTITSRRDPKDPHNLQRLLSLHRAFNQLVKKTKPDLLVIERYFVGNSRGAMAVAEVRALLKLVAAEHKLPFREYIASSVRKNIVGNGRAEKEEVASYILQTFPSLRAIPITLDETDAVAMAMHAMKVEENVTTETVTQTTNSKKKGKKKTPRTKGKEGESATCAKPAGQSNATTKTKNSTTASQAKGSSDLKEACT